MHGYYRSDFSLISALSTAAALLLGIPDGARAQQDIYGATARTSLSASQGGSGSITASANYSQGGAVPVSGQGAASLIDGTLHATSFTGANTQAGQGLDPGIDTYASFWDTVRMNALVGYDQLELDVPFTLTIDGSLNNVASARVRYYFGFDSNFLSKVDSLPWQYLPTGSTSITTTLTVPLTTNPLYIYAELNTLSWVETGPNAGPSSADFGHTLHFGWEIPDWVEYTSASGVFMTNTPPPVQVSESAAPEPGTGALLFTCLLPMAPLVAHRRRA